MRLLLLAFSLISVSCIAEESQSNQVSVGLGMGFTYSGLGTNLAYVSKTDMKYVSLGCVSYSALDGSTCGFGIGWIKTDLISAETQYAW